MKPLPVDLPTCPQSGKLSFPSKRLPPDMRAQRAKKGSRSLSRRAKYISTYKCKHCPYFHQTSGS